MRKKKTKLVLVPASAAGRSDHITKADAENELDLEDEFDNEDEADDEISAAYARARQIEITLRGQKARRAVGAYGRSRSHSSCWVHFDREEDGRVRIDTSWLSIDDVAHLGPTFERGREGCEAIVRPVELDKCFEKVLEVFRRRLFGEG